MYINHSELQDLLQTVRHAISYEWVTAAGSNSRYQTLMMKNALGIAQRMACLLVERPECYQSMQTDAQTLTDEIAEHFDAARHFDIDFIQKVKTHNQQILEVFNPKFTIDVAELDYL